MTDVADILRRYLRHHRSVALTLSSLPDPAEARILLVGIGLSLRLPLTFELRDAAASVLGESEFARPPITAEVVMDNPVDNHSQVLAGVVCWLENHDDLDPAAQLRPGIFSVADIGSQVGPLEYIGLTRRGERQTVKVTLTRPLPRLKTAEPHGSLIVLHHTLGRDLDSGHRLLGEAQTPFGPLDIPSLRARLARSADELGVRTLSSHRTTVGVLPYGMQHASYARNGEMHTWAEAYPGNRYVFSDGCREAEVEGEGSLLRTRGDRDLIERGLMMTEHVRPVTGYGHPTFTHFDNGHVRIHQYSSAD